MIHNLHNWDERPIEKQNSVISDIVSQNFTTGYDLMRQFDYDNPDLLYPTAFGSFIPYDQTSLIIGEEGTGKSIFAMQIAMAAINGGDAMFRNHKTTFRTENVLYVDTELNDACFAQRYAHRDSPGLLLPGNLIHFHPRAACSGSHSDMAELTFDAIEEALASGYTKFVVIDSITRIAQRSFGRNANQKHLMKRFSFLQDKYNATFVIVAHNKSYSPHTRRPKFQQLSRNSHPLIEFADSVIGIQRSTFDIRHRYLKHIKLRGGETSYDENYVIDCIIEPPSDKNFLSLRPGQLLKESQYEQYLNRTAEEIEQQKKAVTAQILRLHNSGMSLRSIAATVGLSKSSVHRYILDATAPDLAIPYHAFNPDSVTLSAQESDDTPQFSTRHRIDIPLFAHYPGDPEYNEEIAEHNRNIEIELDKEIPDNEDDEAHIGRMERRAEQRFLRLRTPYTIVNPTQCPQPDDTPPLRAIPAHVTLSTAASPARATHSAAVNKKNSLVGHAMGQQFCMSPTET